MLRIIFDLGTCVLLDSTFSTQMCVSTAPGTCLLSLQFAEKSRGILALEHVYNVKKRVAQEKGALCLYPPTPGPPEPGAFGGGGVREEGEVIVAVGMGSCFWVIRRAHAPGVSGCPPPPPQRQTWPPM